MLRQVQFSRQSAALRVNTSTPVISQTIRLFLCTHLQIPSAKITNHLCLPRSNNEAGIDDHLPLPLLRPTTGLSVMHHPASGISFPRNFACLQITKTYHSHLIRVSSSSPASPLSSSITPSHFHSRLKTHLFHKSFPP